MNNSKDFKIIYLIKSGVITRKPAFIKSLLLTKTGTGGGELTVHFGDSTNGNKLLTIFIDAKFSKFIDFGIPVFSSSGFYSYLS